MSRLACLILVFFGISALSQAQEVSVAKEGQPIGPPSAQRFARRIEPDLVGRLERLDQYVDFFRRESVTDARLFAFDVSAEAKGDDGVELRGYIEFPESRQALVNFLEALGFKVDDKTESLPADSLGEKRFGLVKAPHSLSYDRPSGRRTAVTDCLIGEPVYLLREDAGHFLVHSGDGYLGYVKADDIHRVDEAEFAEYLEGPRLRMLADFAGDENAGIDVFIPAGARLKYLSTENHPIAALPGAATVMVPEESCEIGHDSAREIDAIVENAKRLIGTRYFWGGKSSKGCDCSGLVQLSFSTVGYNLPRDSYQQFYLGRLTATRWHRAGLRRGDTLYFLGSDGKIRHTGLYLGGDQFIQAVVPRVTISSFNPDDENYDADHQKSFAFAKRLVE